MGGKKKRQEATLLSASSSFRSSSYRQENVPPGTSASVAHHSKTANVGCMSGIFHIMSKYHTRRKFLTFGKKQERNANVQSRSTPPPYEKIPPPILYETVTRHPRDPNTSAGRLSLDQPPRSPAVTPEFRRSSTNNMSPRVVQRLMGLDDIPATPPRHAPPYRAVSTAAEKRRKLLGALEKCDEDLKALKKIIETVRAAQTPPRVAEMERGEEVEEGESEVGSEGPSPVSVLDHHHLSPGHTKRIAKDPPFQQTKPSIRQQKQQMSKKRPGDHEDKAINFLSKPSLSAVVTTTPQPLHLCTAKSSQPLHNTATSSTTMPCSTAMKESVIEVCKDVEWGQTQEVGRIGLLLQDFIFGDLIDEITTDLNCNLHFYSTSTYNLLPFEVCKKKLCF